MFCEAELMFTAETFKKRMRVCMNRERADNFSQFDLI